jgi:hypothetical protein
LKFEVLALLITFGILFSIISSSAVYAQVTNTMGIKITSPTTNQQVPVNNSLIVSGASSDNAVSNCQVSVIVNNIKPYQPALASGRSGTHDYSKWNFTLTPKYTAIKEGENKITARLSCPTNPQNLTKWSSVNFVGVANSQQHVLLSSSSVAAAPTKPTTTTTASTVKQKNVTAPISSNTLPSSSVAAAPTKPTTTTTPTKPTTTENGGALDSGEISTVKQKAKSMDNASKPLSVSIDISKKPVSRGNKQAIVVTVSNANSDEKVVGAEVIGHVFHPAGFVKKEFVGNTDDNGQVLYSWKIGGNAKSSTYIVEAQVSALGYKDKLAKTMFNVNSNSVSTNNPDNMNPTQDNNNDGSTDNMNNFAQHIIENVKRKIKSDGINIEIPLPIPFG